MSEPIVYLNGEYLPVDQAKVPVLDRGFIFGDGIYEVIPVYGGTLFRLEEHLIRLDNSLQAVRISNPFKHSEWQEMLESLLQKNSGTDQSVYVQITRGVAQRDHGFPENTQPTIFAMVNPLITPTVDALQQGISAITVNDIRWQNCHIKAIALLPNILMRQQALDKGATEAIMIRDGNVTEGAASNIFVIKDGIIRTPPKSNHLLPGITRDLVVELAHANELPCEEVSISEAELNNADEIWLTSSTKEIMPVTQLNDNIRNDGQPGPVWQQMYAIFQEYKASLR
ncbi:MAG: D-amino acid aminotransferase [Gammaproteobacteria bacterium]|nr:D-amino acid aminotransferase [Gammaproteobacteria bacterium]MDH5778514.1 D-amino acid aminotransferase [Gammaproteobacteria bacterium]